MSGQRYASTYERLVANTQEPENAQACWLWTGAVRKQYPTLALRRPGKPHPLQHYAHRVMLMQFEPLQPDHEAEHVCCNPLCVNPDHLEPLTGKANRQRRHGILAPRVNYDAVDDGVIWTPIDGTVNKR